MKFLPLRLLIGLTLAAPCLTLAQDTSPAEADPFRRFTPKEGTTVEARLISVSPDRKEMEIVTRKGKTFKTPIVMLTLDDQQYIKDWLKSQAEPGSEMDSDSDSEFANWSGSGRFYTMADDRASIYINGQLAHRGHLGKSRGDLCELKVGDRITVSLTNLERKFQFKGAFGSEDGTVVMHLRAEDFVEVGAVLGTRRDFSMEELEAGDAEAVSERRKNWGADQPLPIANQSQWIWGGDGDKAVLIGIIKPSMFSRQDDPNNDSANVNR